MNASKLIAAVSVSMLLIGAATAAADPLPGEVLKFQQLPLAGVNNSGAIYNGSDVTSVAYPFTNTSGQQGYRGVYAADDFADNLTSPIVHVKWWGNYMVNPNNTQIQKFLISFESDVPAGPNGPSHPGTPLLSQVVSLGALSPGSGTFTETPFNTTLPLRKYNAELNLGSAFPELRDTVYWLKIVALTNDTNLKWGWHNRDYTTQDGLASPLVTPGESNIGPAVSPIWHFQDDAVTGGVDILPNSAGSGASVVQTGYNPTNYTDFADGPQGIGNYSQDLSFEIYTTPTPEPSTIGALGLVAANLLLRRRRAR